MVIDAVCPLVTKVHHELKVRTSKGYTVLYIGHAGHEEAVGTMAVAPDAVHLVQSREDIDAIDGHDGPVALLSQTTLSLDEWQDLREYAEVVFPDIWMPSRSDLCFATTNRQASLKAMTDEADAICSAPWMKPRKPFTRNERASRDRQSSFGADGRARFAGATEQITSECARMPDLSVPVSVAW